MDVRVESDGVETRIMDKHGNDISKKVSGVSFRHAGGGIPSVDLDLASIEFSAVGVPARMLGPGGKEVRRIEYADGSVDEFPAD